MRPRGYRSFYLILSIGCLFFPFVFPHGDKFFSVLAVIASSFSAFLSLRDTSEEVGKQTTDSVILVAFRKLVHSDRLLSIWLIQIAVVYQSISILMSW